MISLIMKTLVTAVLLALLASLLVDFTHYDFWLAVLKNHLGAEARSFTPQVFQRLLVLNRILSPLLLGLFFLLLKKRVQIQEAIHNLAIELAADLKSLGMRWSRFITQEKSDAVALLWIILGGVVLRAFFFDTPVQVDEASSFVIYASKPFYNIVTQYMGPDQVFHSVLVHAMMRIFGTSLVSVRAPAFLAGILLIPATYFLSKALFRSRISALVSAGLIAASPYLIQYSVVSRGYTLLVLLSVLAFWFAVQIREQGTKLAILGYILITAFGFWVIPTMAYPFALTVFWLGTEWLLAAPGINRPGLLKNTLIAAAGTLVLTGVFYLPIIMVSGLDSLIHNPFVAPERWDIFLRYVLPFLKNTFLSWNWDKPAFFVGVLLLGCAAATIRHQAISKFKSPLILSAIPLVAVLFLQRHIPYTRIWIFIIPLYLILAAAGCCTLLDAGFGSRKKTATILLALGISALGTSVALDHLKHQEEALGDFNAVHHGADTAKWFQSRIHSEDIVLLTWPDDVTLQYYFEQAGLSGSQIRSNRVIAYAKTYLVLNRLRYGLEESLQVSVSPWSKVQRVTLLQKWGNTEIYELIF